MAQPVTGTHDQPGGTSGATVVHLGPSGPPVNDETPGCIGVAEAIEHFQVSLSTLRKRIKAGEIEGLFQVTGKKGNPAYRIPIAWLETNYKPRYEAHPEEAVRTARSELVDRQEDLEELRSEVRHLRDQLIGRNLHLESELAVLRVMPARQFRPWQQAASA